MASAIWNFTLDEQHLDEQELQQNGLPLQPAYLATSASFRNWRNRTCDAFDVLHWEALGTSAKAGGYEDIVFLHLHLARLMTLTPMRELLSFIDAAKNPAYALDCSLLPSELYDASPSKQHSLQVVAIWANKDRYKARLAVVHAGAVYWHSRRYSTDTFSQPFAVYLAAITLWAFGTFWKSANGTSPLHDHTAAYEGDKDVRSDGTTELNGLSFEAQATAGFEAITAGQYQQPGPGPNTPSVTTRKKTRYRRRMPTHIQIDRPVDDELVQHFIRFGEEMTISLEGHDNLASDGGVKHVLEEGLHILDSLANVWRLAENYSKVLEAVIRNE